MPGVVLCIGNAGPDMFRPLCRANAIRRWTVSMTGPARRWTGSPADSVPPPRSIRSTSRPLPFLTWARRAGGWAMFRRSASTSTRTYGLWHAFRAALLFERDPDLPAMAAAPNPCDSCRAKPCLSACPVGAFDGEGYDVAACARHLMAPAGDDCMAQGCLARRACPVGSATATARTRRGFTWLPSAGRAVFPSIRRGKFEKIARIHQDCQACTPLSNRS